METGNGNLMKTGIGNWKWKLETAGNRKGNAVS